MKNHHHPFTFSPSTWIIPALMVLSIWVVFYLDISFNLHLNEHGIYPRTLIGMQGILFSPFLHGDLNHIANNTLPLFILTTALIYFYRDLSLKVLVYGVLLSGFITWVIGRESYHIGASGLIYVLVSFIFFKGMMTKYYRLMALSFAVVLLYGGMVWYVFPEIDNTISWEGHLGGLIAGFVFATRFKTPNYLEEIQYEWQKPDFNAEEDAFMRQFDENGNFVNPPRPEELEELSITPPTIQYVYHYVENPESKDKEGVSSNPDRADSLRETSN
jgi:membrane associated rhomboid family serine protease